MDWTALGSISTAVATIALIISLCFIWFQLRVANKSRQAEAFFRVIDFVQNQEVRQARKHLINLKKDHFVDWKEDDIAFGEIVCNTYNRVGLMIKEGMIPAKTVLPRFHFSIQVCWVAAQPMVKEYRTARSIDWWRDFEWLYKRAQKSYPEDMAEMDAQKTHEEDLTVPPTE